MMMNAAGFRHFRWTVLAALLLCGVLHAQDGDNKPKKDPPPAGGTTVADNNKERFKDPTEGSKRSQEALQPAEKSAAAAPVIKVPEIILKAYVHAEGKAPLAIIEIKGKGTTTVRDGSLLTITGEGGGAITLTVKKVADESVTIEVPGLKDAMLVK
jgi:hypothetical protein